MSQGNGGQSGVGLNEALVRLVIDEHHRGTAPRLERLWTYYRNDLHPLGVAPGESTSPRWYELGQEMGLPPRIVGVAMGDDRAARRREVVVENDIAWRIHTMVDFMFGKPVTLLSTAKDEGKRRTIQRVLDRVWEASGGIALFQDMSLLGHVYGHVDLVVRVDERAIGAARRAGPRDGDELDAMLHAAEAVRIEAVEPTRGIPVLDEDDYRELAGYVIRFEQGLNEPEPEGLVERLVRAGRETRPRRKRREVIETITADRRRVRRDGRVVEDERLAWTGGRVPVAHIQNISQPFRYEGLSEVEPLIPLQDELNTRLSDRASRVTLQSFRMYLAKGVDGFERMPVGPGQVYSTDNMEASIQEFGGDTHTPGEERHLDEVREAFDKVSGVPPLASGVVRAKIGNLSSANALKITPVLIVIRLLPPYLMICGSRNHCPPGATKPP